MLAVGFSSHAPIPFPNDWTMTDDRVQPYLDAVNELKREYSGKIEIYAGMEIDDFEGDERDLFHRYPLDYRIGSVHLFPDPAGGGYFAIDGSEEEFQRALNLRFAGDMRVFGESYYRQLASMLERYRPEIVGHLDVIKKNNGDGKYFSGQEEWYSRAVSDFLDVAAKQGTIVEVNTGGIIRGYTKETYPSPRILAECRKREIPVMINSDAHAAQWIDGYFDLAVAVLKDAGYRRVMTMHEGKWVEVGLE